VQSNSRTAPSPQPALGSATQPSSDSETNICLRQVSDRCTSIARIIAPHARRSRSIDLCVAAPAHGTPIRPSRSMLSAPSECRQGCRRRGSLESDRSRKKPKGKLFTSAFVSLRSV
jgi:hypothetical protein